MTQAFNLALLANNLNTSGRLDASDGLVNAVPVANGGTGLTSAGTSGNVLTSNGSTWTSAPLSSYYQGGRGQVFTSSGTFTVPDGVTAVKVTVCGGGGGGGAGYTTSATGVSGVGGGGGGGGFAIDFVTGLTPGGTVTVTVGAAGAAGSAGSGGAGGTSSFGAYVSATGGGGGAGAVNVNTNAGGAGGSTSGAAWGINGGAGLAAAGNLMSGAGGATRLSQATNAAYYFYSCSVNSLAGYTSIPTTSPEGTGGKGSSVRGTVYAGTGYGSGGGGGIENASGTGNYPGGAGTQGFVIVEW
jgi:hypothetical protein